MKQIHLLLLLVAFVHAYGQTKTSKPTPGAAADLPTFSNVLELNNRTNCAAFQMIRTGYDLGDIKLTPPSLAADRFDKMTSTSRPNEESIYWPVYPLFVKNRVSLSDYLRNTIVMGRVPNAYYLGKDGLPVYFSNKNNGLNMIISGLGYDKMFNILQTTSRKRAATVISAMIMPSISKAESLLSIPGLKTLAYTVIYGCADFSNPKSKAEGAIIPTESITMCAPVALYKQYLAGSLSEDAFFKQAEFYIKEYDSDSGLKRIELKTE